jgi:hypothetical protein
MKKIFAFSIILFALYSCKKDDKKPVTKSDFLTSGLWIVTAAVTDDDGDGTYETDEYADFAPCYKDNVWTFKTNGSVVMDESATKCDPSDSQVITSQWQLVNNETGLILASDSYSVLQLDANQVVLKLDYGANRSSKITFSKH